MIFIFDLVQNPRWGYKKREKNLKIHFFQNKKNREYFEAGQLEGKLFLFQNFMKNELARFNLIRKIYSLLIYFKILAGATKKQEEKT